MNQLLSVSKAIELTNTAREGLYGLGAFLNVVDKDMKESIRHGLMRTHIPVIGFPDLVINQVIEQLKDLGYEVSTCKEDRPQYLSIRWEKEGS